MKENRGKYPIEILCKVLEVTRAGYYHWQKNRNNPKRNKEHHLMELIQKHYKLSKKRYGLDRILKEIRKEGQIVNRKAVHRLMKKYGIVSITKKKFKKTTKTSAGAKFSENLLKGNFQASKKNEIWTSDITYLWTKEGWLYLAVIMDIYNREIIGWCLSEGLTADMVLKAIMMAILNRKPSSGVIFHSDRGSQYTSNQLREILFKYEFKQSMSSTGNCYDNAITESFFSTLKKELVYLTDFGSRDQARIEIFEYLEIFYNRKRSHSALGFVSPVEFLINKELELYNRSEIKSEVA